MSPWDDCFGLDPSFLNGEIKVRVLDYWTGEPLKGVPIYFGGTEESARGNMCGRKGGSVTDEDGFGPVIEMPVGPVYVLVPPYFIQQVFVVEGEQIEVTFECPDFVKSIRHGFNW